MFGSLGGVLNFSSRNAGSSGALVWQSRVREEVVARRRIILFSLTALPSLPSPSPSPPDDGICSLVERVGVLRSPGSQNRFATEKPTSAGEIGPSSLNDRPFPPFSFLPAAIFREIVVEVDRAREMARRMNNRPEI